MTDPRDIPEAVLWHEGMMLAPQHFQLAARRGEQLLAYQMRAVRPYAWGVRRLLLDASQLPHGVVRVLELEAVMPDGLVIVHPLPDTGTLECRLEPQELEDGPKVVFVAVAARLPQGQGNALERYHQVGGPEISDETAHDGTTLAVTRLRPSLGLTVGDSAVSPPHARRVHLPLLRLGLRDQAFVLESYAPPCLEVVVGSLLDDSARRVATRLRVKATALAEKLRAPTLEGGEVSTGETWSAVRALVATLPKLEALLLSQVAHPFDVYLALCETLGHVSCLGGQPMVPRLAAYVHDDPLSAFTQVEQAIASLLDRVREPYETIRFRHHDDGGFSLALNAAWLRRDLVV
ncbi:MAG: type VI secretion system baseplate subunit TssK, partial [Rhodospirillales bacterium]|nr:type VI secretion system baseplate subunit TssK [Rhodospirillales bacterium]